MKIYFSGGSHKDLDATLAVQREFPNAGVLTSFAYKLETRRWVDSPIKNLIVDSGAFTVYKTTGVPLDVGEYTEFLHEHRDRLDFAIQMDDISDVDRTVANYDEMRAAFGDFIIPVYHFGRPWEVLEYFTQHADIIGIGGIAIAKWTYRTLPLALQRVFDRAPEGTKFHALGLSAMATVIRFPFYSVDNSSWLSGRSYGRLLMDDGQYLMVSTRGKTNPQELEAGGWGDVVRELGLPFPFPDDFDYTAINHVNMRQMAKLLTSVAPTERPDVAQNLTLF